MRTLDLLDEFGVKATFFALGWVADEMPEVLREIAARGHEVASKGYFHRTIHEMTPAEFRDDVQRSREAIERATGTRVVGYRIARGHVRPRGPVGARRARRGRLCLRLELLSALRSRSLAEPWRRFPFTHRHAKAQIEEFPLATWEVPGGVLIPIAGGAYLRQFPHALISRALDQWDRKQHVAAGDVLPRLGARPRAAEDHRRTGHHADAPVPQPREDACDPALLPVSATRSSRSATTWVSCPSRCSLARGRRSMSTRSQRRAFRSASR